MAEDWMAQVSEQETATVADAMVRVRTELEAAWTGRSRQEAQKECDRRLGESPWTELRVVEGSAYRMEGECGRWSFKTFQVVDDQSGRVVYDTRRNLPVQRGEARQRTDGFRELGLFLGGGKRSFRECSKFLARVRHQDEETVAATTLRDFVEREGLEIAEQLNAEVTRVLAEPRPKPRPTTTPAVKPQDLQQAIEKAQIPDALLAEAMANPVPFTPPDTTVSVSADAVFCKRQKARRGARDPVSGEQRRTVSTCCASLSFQGRRLALAALDYPALACAVLAAIVANRLVPMACCLLSDGERKLRDEFVAAVQPAVTAFHHVLDWHHLQQRCGQLMSLALKGKEVRNTWLREVLRLLWHGCTDSAIRLLPTIPETAIKARKPLQDLAEYLARRKEQIPVYSVRKCLGLPNSSNPVEKTNDLLVSSRQKGRGMSWSPEGSYALAAVRLISCNNQEKEWMRERRFSLVLPRAAA